MMRLNPSRYCFKEVVMSLRVLFMFMMAVIFISLINTSAMKGQAGVEYGGVASMGGAGVTASAEMPSPKVAPPASAPAAGAKATPGAAFIPAGSADAAAKANLKFFQDHSGLDAARVSLHSVPDHGQAWIDGKFVGTTPLDLKIAPGHHRISVRAPNMQESVRELDMAGKQSQTIDFPLKSLYQNQINIHWPSQK
jgi:hypothetical protein